MPVQFLDEQNASKSLRTKQILAGLYLSRFDKEGLHALGFSSFTEAFNAIGFALGARPASIKNSMFLFGEGDRADRVVQAIYLDCQKVGHPFLFDE